MKGCYAGWSGTWIVATKNDDGELQLSIKDKLTVCKKATFTEYSREKIL